jgi:prepilin-type N-terminal cleavage/methylation domain-containing protein
MRKNRNKKSGFTLVEMLIAASLFAVIGSITLSIFLSMNRSQRTFTTRETLYDDGQFIMNELARKISENAIDYEEYFNRSVIDGQYGMNFGYYAAQFYNDPQQSSSGAPNICNQINKDNPGGKPIPTNCINTGQNPPKDNLLFAPDGNAFMLPGMTAAEAAPGKSVFCDDYDPQKILQGVKRNYVCVKELYLIDADAKEKTMLAPLSFKVGDSGSEKTALTLGQISMNQMKEVPGLFSCPEKSPCINSYPIAQTDLINQPIAQQGTPIPTWATVPKYNFESNASKTYENLASGAQASGTDFSPITPSRISVKAKFIITPVEDPHKAFSETEPDQSGYPLRQPYVRVILELQPVTDLIKGKTDSKVTLQRQISPAVAGEVRSYPPKTTCKAKADASGCSLLRKQ